MVFGRNVNEMTSTDTLSKVIFFSVHIKLNNVQPAYTLRRTLCDITNPNQSFTQIMNGTAEFGIGVQMLGQGKQKYIDWTQMIFRTDNLFGSRIPRRVSGFNNIVRPFSLGVWIGVLVSLAAVSIALWVFHGCYTGWPRGFETKNTIFAF